MKHVLIAPDTKENLDLFLKLARQLKIRTRLLSDAEAEDFALGVAIREGKKSKVVSKAKVLKALEE